jgi:hypothetical protein
MDESKIKFYCQFCLQLQDADCIKIPINRKIKQKFYEFTNLKVNFGFVYEFFILLIFNFFRLTLPN